MQAVYRTVVVKKELSQKAKLSGVEQLICSHDSDHRYEEVVWHRGKTVPFPEHNKFCLMKGGQMDFLLSLFF